MIYRIDRLDIKIFALLIGLILLIDVLAFAFDEKVEVNELNAFDQCIIDNNIKIDESVFDIDDEADDDYVELNAEIERYSAQLKETCGHIVDT